MNNILIMPPRWLLPVFFILLIFIVLPVNAHVPISADNNNDITHALTVEKPTKSYAIYGHLHEAGDVGYYKFSLNTGDRLTLSLMTPGFDAPVPDMIVMSPGISGNIDAFLLPVTVPQGYSAEIIKGQKPVKAEYEPFSPAAIFEIASYSENITIPGTYYVAVISPADETQYSIAVGYLEEFSFLEWVLVPINVINIHLWEGQSVIEVLAPFLGTVILGFFLIIRRERKMGRKNPPWFWFASFAGLLYLSGASIILVQMIRALMITGFSGAAALTLVFVLIPIILAVWLLRIARFAASRSPMDRISLGCAGLLGLIFWGGLIIGPVLALLAAVVPEHV